MPRRFPAPTDNQRRPTLRNRAASWPTSIIRDESRRGRRRERPRSGSEHGCQNKPVHLPSYGAFATLLGWLGDTEVTATGAPLADSGTAGAGRVATD